MYSDNLIIFLEQAYALDFLVDVAKCSYDQKRYLATAQKIISLLPASRKELAAACSMSPATITVYTKALCRINAIYLVKEGATHKYYRS